MSAKVDVIKERLADTGLVVMLSGLTFTMKGVDHATDISNLILVIVSIFVGLLSGTYYFLKVLEKLRERKVRRGAEKVEDESDS